MKIMSNSLNSRFWPMFLLPFAVILLPYIIIPVVWTVYTKESVLHVIPYIIDYTGFREIAKYQWQILGMQIGNSIPVNHTQIPSIEAHEYTFEKLREITEGFSTPAVVRGLFSDTPAITNWGKQGYLKSRLGQYEIPVIRNAKYGNPQNNRTNQYFRDIIDDIMNEDTEKSYLFFPMKSRPNKNHTFTENFNDLSNAVNELMIDDLNVNTKIWNGFGTDVHKKNYRGGQLIIGKGGATLESTTGTGKNSMM